MIRPQTCLVLECDTCGSPLDDFAEVNGVPHFTTEFEIVAFLGGLHEGRLLEGTGASGGVLLPDGTFFCYACRILPHTHVNGYLIDDVCPRCGKLRDQHPTFVDPAPAPAARPPRPPVGVSARQSWCVTSCAELHQFPEQGIPEPADGARIEFGFQTDRYAAWRDDEQVVLAGWPAAMCWTLYPSDTGHTWSCLQRTFGPGLAQAILLAPAGLLLPAQDAG